MWNLVSSICTCCTHRTWSRDRSCWIITVFLILHYPENVCITFSNSGWVSFPSGTCHSTPTFSLDSTCLNYGLYCCFMRWSENLKSKDRLAVFLFPKPCSPEAGVPQNMFSEMFLVYFSLHLSHSSSCLAYYAPLLLFIGFFHFELYGIIPHSITSLHFFLGGGAEQWGSSHLWWPSKRCMMNAVILIYVSFLKVFILLLLLFYSRDNDFISESLSTCVLYQC